MYLEERHYSKNTFSKANTRQGKVNVNMHRISIYFLPVVLRITKRANNPEVWGHVKQKEDVLIHGCTML